MVNLPETLNLCSILQARVAELVDALDSKSSSGNRVWVRFPPRVRIKSLAIDVRLFALDVGSLSTEAVAQVGIPTPGTSKSLAIDAGLFAFGVGSLSTEAVAQVGIPTPGTFKSLAIDAGLFAFNAGSLSVRNFTLAKGEISIHSTANIDSSLQDL